MRRGRTGVQAQRFMCHSERETGGKVKMQGEKEIVKVRLFIHKGFTIPENKQCTREVNKRVEAGWGGWRRVFAVICDRKTAARVKGKVYKILVRLAMMYDLETVSLRKQEAAAELYS